MSFSGFVVRVPTMMLCLVLSLTIAAEVRAQQPTAEQRLQLEQLRQQMSPDRDVEEPEIEGAHQAGAVPLGPLLDRQISRTEYQLGPGDVVTLSIVGYRNAIFPLTVGPEGSVIIPGVRVVSVGGLNLDQAEQRVRQQVRRVYPDADVGVSLTAVRSFKIFLVGDVPRPGVRPATAVTRVSEVVPTANEDGIIYRNVSLRRANNQVMQVDLARFLRTGDLSFNPTLRQGDIVQVPTIGETVSITGQVAFPGTYEFQPAETLADLVRLANGDRAFPADAADSVLLMRFRENPRGEVQMLARGDAAGALGDQMLLEPFDAVFVPRVAYYKQQTTATIEGEVMRPGIYPIRLDGTAVSDLIAMAGGLTPGAAPTNAVLRREPSRVPGDTIRPLEPVRRDLEGMAAGQLTREEIRSLQVTSRADETDVIINLTEAGPADRLMLEDGDLLFIPRQRNDVVVLGAAGSPGIVAFEPGQSVDYFVEMAGGYSRRADRREVVIQRAGLGTRLHRDDIEVVQPGDRIIIPFRERRTFMEQVVTAQGIVGTISGVILTIIGIERLWSSIR